MFNFLFNNKGEDKMARAKLSKTQKVLNLLNSGAEVTWKALRIVCFFDNFFLPLVFVFLVKPNIIFSLSIG